MPGVHMEVADECAGCGTCKKGVCFTVGNLTPVARCEQFAIEMTAKLREKKDSYRFF